MRLKVEGTQNTRLIDLERSLFQARTLVCGRPLVRSLLFCIRESYGALEENRIVSEHRLDEYLAEQ